MIKPAYKTVEGQSLGTVLVGGLYLLYENISNSNIKLPPKEDLLQYATSAKEIAEALSATNLAGLESFVGLGKVGMILFFMYKIYTKFLDSRFELKKKDLEING